MQDKIEELINRIDHAFDKITQKSKINTFLSPSVVRILTMGFVAGGIVFITFSIAIFGLILVIFGIGLLIWLVEIIGVLALTFILLFKKKNDIEWGILTGLLISIIGLAAYIAYIYYT